ncbi:GPI alpha-1,6-mannosyltransferase 2-like [Oculina patagonica]
MVVSGIVQKFNMADEVAVVRLAIFSRFLLLLFQVVVNEFISDYDTSSFVDESGVRKTGWCDFVLQQIFGGFGKWDAAYFLKIAEEGYKYEQYMAFFPLYPWTLRFLTRTLQPALRYFISEHSLFLACGWVLNTAFFALAAVSLYRLTLGLFGKKNVALVSSLLFCINPASVFMSSLYTESLFSCLQFTALCYLEQECPTIAVLLFGLGCATRSNGVLSCGFVTHRIIKNFVSTEVASLQSGQSLFTLLRVYNAVRAFLKIIILNGIVLAPFILFQFYGYSLYCTPQTELTQDTVNHSPWCDKLIPFSYSYIQDSYWNVGFLRYFELKQIPNFLLATPMIFLSSHAVLIYCCNRENLEMVKTLGLLQRKDKPDNMARRPIHQTAGRSGRPDTDFYHSPAVLVYVFHLAFMTLFGFTSMHVQVITRFIASASPLIYWYCAHVIIKDTADLSHRHCSKWRSKLIVGYFLLYFFIGTVLHCNFYPWT